MYKRFNHLINGEDVVITLNEDGTKYRIYHPESKIIWFLLFIPIIGQIMALIGFICACSRKIYVEDKKIRKELPIIYSTTKK